VNWEGLKVTHQTPSSFPQVYSGHQITIFALICGDFNEQARVSLEGKIAGQSSTDEEMLQIDCLLSEFKSVQGNTMHKFGIGCLIKELEHDSSQQANIVELSLKYALRLKPIISIHFQLSFAQVLHSVQIHGIRCDRMQ